MSNDVCEVTFCKAFCGYPYCGERLCKTYCSNTAKYRIYVCSLRTTAFPFIMSCFACQVPFYCLYCICSSMMIFCNGHETQDPECDSINNTNCFLCAEMFCCKTKHDITSRYYFENKFACCITEKNKLHDAITRQPVANVTDAKNMTNATNVTDDRFVSSFVPELLHESVTESATSEV